MASRRVIADSDDEDVDDRPLTPLKEAVEEIPPEIEPLSPQLPDTQKPISSTTDQSFFASVYDEQQSRAFEQSQLIEQIVRQSQKASGSNEELSLTNKGKAKTAEAYSSVNIASSVALDNLENQPPLLTGGRLGTTTPQKSVPGEWDVPSSAESATTSRVAKSSKGKKEKSYGKQGRTPSKIFRTSAAADIFMGDNTMHGSHPKNNEDELSPRSATKRRKVSLHDPVLDMPAPANFYIAQSNLTTMQKLEYQRINVSQHGYSGLPVSLPNPKSSGVSTVAYSTPSRYASSGPPLPWERSPMADRQPAETPDIINIASSPDVITADHHGNAPIADMGPPYILTREVETPIGDSTTGEPPSKKRKKPKDIRDEDELAQDQSVALNVDNHKQDDHKRRRHNEHRIDSPSLNEDEDIELVIHPHEEPQKMELEEPPIEDTQGIDNPAPEIPAVEPPIPAIAPEPIQLEAQPAPQPKKRGRKKKQPTNEQTIQDQLPIENQATAQDSDSATKCFETPVEPEKAKKKRGRPRKSDPAKTETPAVLEFEPIVSSKTPGNDAESEDPISEETKVTKKLKKKKQAQKQEDMSIDESTADENRDRDASPLKEVSNNTRTPSQKSTSKEAVLAKPVIESPASPNSASKSQGKAHINPKTTPTTTQPKVPYRVGLSKRTRIASLLKVIKR